jgi:hypothetical protein
VFKKPPYDGMLVSMAIVSGTAGSTGRYTLGQQRRFAIEGAREFLRVTPDLKLMGDCGAFTYVKEPVPPVTIDQVARFYDESGFDFGASVDHIILEYNANWDRRLPGIESVPEDCQRRQELTIELARDFQRLCRKDKVRFEPIGIAQGWSPKSYARAVSVLQKMGYRYIALGGLVPLKSSEILEVLEAASPKLKPSTRLHLFGVTRLDHVREFTRHGVVSFDSTSPLTQAFKEDRDNYYGRRRNYAAIRVPQVDVNPQLKNRVLSGEVKQAEAFRLERECLDALRRFDRRRFPRRELIGLLTEYQELFGSTRKYAAEYEALLKDRPWNECRCAVCRALGIDVVIFRGAERNRRRGFHNVHVTYNRLKRIRAKVA